MSALSAAPSKAPSQAERRLTLTIAALAALGLGVAAYLTYVHYAGIEPFCTGGGGCEKVQTSSYATLGGVPVALLGLAGYLGILASLRVPGERGVTITALLALVGFGFSLYLTYLELFEIDAICQWCVASAALMTALAGLSMARLLRLE
jgi:uncharacterized membrane protein